MNQTAPGSQFSAPLRQQLPFLITGAALVIAGGLLAAATAYVTTQKTAWATAYIVLIGGVVQIVLGVALAVLAPRVTSALQWLIFAAFNLGNIGVLAGQLTATVILTDLGILVFAASLALAFIATRRGSGGEASPHPGWQIAFRVLLAFLTLSLLTGLVLAHLAL